MSTLSGERVFPFMLVIFVFLIYFQDYIKLVIAVIGASPHAYVYAEMF